MIAPLIGILLIELLAPALWLAAALPVAVILILIGLVSELRAHRHHRGPY